MFHLNRLKNYTKETKQFKTRVVKSVILISILLFLLVARLFNLQILNHKLYTNLAAHNQLENIPIEPNRGLIYDRNGVLLAENLPILSLNIVAEQIKDLKTTLEDLKTIINITSDDIKKFNRALKQRHNFEHIPIKTKLTPEEVAIFYVNQYRFPGVVVSSKMIRHYPLANDLVNVVGYVGRINKQDLKNINESNYNASDFIGKVGIEKYYENILRGKIGYKEVEVDVNGKIVRVLKITPPIPGDTLYLTIDSKLQQAARNALNKEKGAVVAIDPNNGEVLALVSNPSFDPNLFANGIDSSTFNELQLSSSKPMYNRATKAHYPFASTIKPFIALQGLDTNIITTEFKISDPGWFKLENSKHIYRDHQHNGHGIVNITKAIMVSCDIFFYDLAMKLGIGKIDDMLERFGFGSKTNIDIAEESSGIVASPKWKLSHTGKSWYPGNTVVSGIGQGDMATTPLQLANGVAALAKHGKRFQPHLLLMTQKPDGIKISKSPMPLPSVVLKNPKNWNVVINAMQGVISDPIGTGYKSFGSNTPYTVAGKTGGAQLYHHKIVNENSTPESEDGIPVHLRNHRLFIAFAPVEEPQIALAVITENISMAAKVARKVLDAYLIKSDADDDEEELIDN